LLHENGQASDLCIHEISPAGVLVESGEMSAPADFDLWLPLPEQDPIELHGSRVRRTTSQLTAFRLDILPSQQSERLRHFIFQQHRLDLSRRVQARMFGDFRIADGEFREQRPNNRRGGQWCGGVGNF